MKDSEVKARLAELGIDYSPNRRRKQIAFLIAAMIVVFCTTYMLILPAITMEKRKTVIECSYDVHTHTADCYDENNELICGMADFVCHKHNDDCYDKNGDLICPLEVIEAHVHNDDCYIYPRELICEDETHEHGNDCYSQEPLLVCDIPLLHEHNDDCFDGDGKFICGKLELREHVHGDACFVYIDEDDTGLSDEETELVALINERIASLPTADEASEIMTDFIINEDDDGFAEYYQQIKYAVLDINTMFEALSNEAKLQVSDMAKVNDYSWVYTMQTEVRDMLHIEAVNQRFSWSNYGNSLMYYDDSGTGKTVTQIVGNELKYWTYIRVENVEGAWTVTDYIAGEAAISKGNIQFPADGFIIFYHGNIGYTVDVNIDYTVTVEPDNLWTQTKNHSTSSPGRSFGTVTFTDPGSIEPPEPESPPKAEKDNTSKLHKLQAANTYDFITINLYDYGSGSTTKNINEKFNANPWYPAFQQEGGSPSKFVLTSILYDGNLGNIVTSDPISVDGIQSATSIAPAESINGIYNGANYPLSANHTIEGGIMKKTLLGGYPALAHDNLSLAYLWGGTDEGYSKKINTDNIDGLFLYDPETGSYNFNSREMAAVFDQNTNKFDLYNEILTPNYIMYPFGNFLPFQNIVNDCKQVSEIRRDYFVEQLAQAQYLYDRAPTQAKAIQYQRLIRTLEQLIPACDAEYGADWSGDELLKAYFSSTTKIPDWTGQFDLSRMYSLDYDVDADFYFGMEIKMDLVQPKDGLTGPNNDQEIIFYFTGDDDVWIYIDGRLFLDLSGIHRHVGGEINFTTGTVKYYDLDLMKGDVSDVPYETVSFSELVADPSLLNENGTFADYTTHNFHFYYMERGSGSGICRINFNFPVLRKNSLSVKKELTVNSNFIGDPDFYFQVMKEDNSGPLIGEGVEYVIQDNAGNDIGTGTTGTDGVFTIKAGQTALFEDLEESLGRHYVRELLEKMPVLGQYDVIKVNGVATTVDEEGVSIGGKEFAGVISSVGDLSEGSTMFRFDNKVDESKFGTLEISKDVHSENDKYMDDKFEIFVSFDGQPVEVGLEYTVGDEVRTVEREGYILVGAEETAVFHNVLAGTVVFIQENPESGTNAGYTVEYTYDENEDLDEVLSLGEDDNGKYITGTICCDTSIGIVITNITDGTSIEIPIQKIVLNPDGDTHNFRFLLERVTSFDDLTPVEGGTVKHLTVGTDSDIKDFCFELIYEVPYFVGTSADYYYKITETTGGDPAITDESFYVVKIHVIKTGGNLYATLEEIRKDGEAFDISQPLGFVNTITGALSLEKVVRKNTARPTTSQFEFTVMLTDGDGMPVMGTFDAVRSYRGNVTEEQVAFDSNGSCVITLRSDEKLLITNIPVGYSWHTVEADTEFEVSIQVSPSTAETPGKEADGTITPAETNVKYINTLAYELPRTGGSGTAAFTAAGVSLLICGAVLTVLRRYKRKEK